MNLRRQGYVKKEWKSERVMNEKSGESNENEVMGTRINESGIEKLIGYEVDEENRKLIPETRWSMTKGAIKLLLTRMMQVAEQGCRQQMQSERCEYTEQRCGYGRNTCVQPYVRHMVVRTALITTSRFIFAHRTQKPTCQNTQLFTWHLPLCRNAINTGAIGAMHRGPLQRRAPIWENSESRPL